MLNKIYLPLFILILLTNIISAKENIYIVSTVEDQIITNHDIFKESNYLKILNPEISQLNTKQIQKIAKESLVREIIKKKEIKKILDFNQENNFVGEQIKILYNKLNFKNEGEFKNYLLNSSSYTFKEIEEKIKIEILWNELIYFKYNSQIKIDKERILKKVNELQNKKNKEYLLSEIIFTKKKGVSIEKLFGEIKLSIQEIGFDNTANILVNLKVLNLEVNWDG